MRSVTELTADMARVLDRHERDASAIENDPRLKMYLPEVAREKRDSALTELSERDGARVLELTRQLWGSEVDATKPLQGGVIWDAKSTASRLLREAKTVAGNDVNWQRLQSEADRVPAIFGQCRNIGEVGRVYDAGDNYVRLGLQQVGHTYLPRKFAGDVSLGAFTAKLASDRRDFFTSEQVTRAQERVERVNASVLGAWQTSTRAVRLFGGGGAFASAHTPAGILSRVAHNYSVEPTSMRETHSFAKGPARVMTKAALSVPAFGK